MQRPLVSVGFIGGGNMATAMVSALADTNSRPTITVSEPDPTKHATLVAHGAATTTDNRIAVAAAQVVVLAIKPQLAETVVPGLAAAWTTEKVLVSILAGMSTQRLASWLPAGARIVRAMPNTPMAIGMGMVGLCRGAHATETDLVLAETLFANCAKVLRITDESRMDALTAVSGSGPAYVFRTVEALIAAALAQGFTQAEAELLVGQTLAGSVEFLMTQGIGQAQRLREQVTSPGGTTAAALQALENGSFGALWVKAVSAAAERGRELGRN